MPARWGSVAVALVSANGRRCFLLSGRYLPTPARWSSWSRPVLPTHPRWSSWSRPVLPTHPRWSRWSRPDSNSPRWSA